MERIQIQCTDAFGFNVGLRYLWVHSPDMCDGEACCIHNPSDHRMKDWPQLWRADRQLMERICLAHGVGHPDPDDISLKRDHGQCDCCGWACTPPLPEEVGWYDVG